MAITIVAQPSVHNFGDLTAVTATLTIGADQDSWTPGLRTIEGMGIPPQTNLTNVDANTANPPALVFTTTGVVTSVQVTVWGYP